MRRCSKCGVEKDETEFYKPVGKRKRAWCKECCNRAVRKRDKNVYVCAKKLCSNIPKEKLVKLECKVCGKEFGRVLSDYNSSMRQSDRFRPKYCSNSCHYIGMTKKWQQTQSPYAKKIKELQKEYK